jgi:hypothetical protein
MAGRPSMIYLSGCVCSARHPRLGFLITPDMGNRVPEGVPVAGDNACFANPDTYSDERYLDRLSHAEASRWLFAPAPDVVGDHAATVARSGPMLRRIRDAGIKAAFCAQDGWDESTTPWDEFDALFIGGTTGFKFRGGRDAAKAAKARGKWVHMGRVNSLVRLRAAASIGCDSADGTHIRFEPDVAAPRVMAWLDQLSREPMLELR